MPRGAADGICLLLLSAGVVFTASSEPESSTCMCVCDCNTCKIASLGIGTATAMVCGFRQKSPISPIWFVSCPKHISHFSLPLRRPMQPWIVQHTPSLHTPKAAWSSAPPPHLLDSASYAHTSTPAIHNSTTCTTCQHSTHTAPMRSLCGRQWCPTTPAATTAVRPGPGSASCCHQSHSMAAFNSQQGSTHAIAALLLHHNQPSP